MPVKTLLPEPKIITSYLSGESSGEIAEKYKVRPLVIIRLLRRNNIPRRLPKEAAKIRTESGRANPAAYWTGKKQPKAMIESRTSKIRGEQHYLWKGGKSKRDYRKLRQKVKCENCGSRLNLGIHHKNLDHYDNEANNLQVLCVGCHMSLHKKLYWDAKRNGKPIPKSNSIVGWRR